MTIKQDFDEMFAEAATSEACKLKRASLVKDIVNNDMRLFLRKLYGSVDPTLQRMASYINSAVTQDRVTFFMSNRIGKELVKKDPNTDFGEMNSKTYNFILYKLTDKHKWIKRITSPIGRQAGIFEIINPTILNIITENKGIEYYEFQKAAIIYQYNELKQKNKTTLESQEIQAIKKAAKAGIAKMRGKE